MISWLWNYADTGKDGLTRECVRPDPSNPSAGTDAGAAPATQINGITFAEIDSLYFANTPAAKPMNMTVSKPGGPINVLGAGVPAYDDGRTTWISTDYSP